jgi:hypothetical protein
MNIDMIKPTDGETKQTPSITLNFILFNNMLQIIIKEQSFASYVEIRFISLLLDA